MHFFFCVDLLMNKCYENKNYSKNHSCTQLLQFLNYGYYYSLYRVKTILSNINERRKKIFFKSSMTLLMICISARDLYNRSYKVGVVLFTDRTRFFVSCVLKTQPAFPIALALAYLLITYTTPLFSNPISFYGIRPTQL